MQYYVAPEVMSVRLKKEDGGRNQSRSPVARRWRARGGAWSAGAAVGVPAFGEEVRAAPELFTNSNRIPVSYFPCTLLPLAGSYESVSQLWLLTVACLLFKIVQKL